MVKGRGIREGLIVSVEAPTKEPRIEPTAPAIDPDTRLDPDKLCPVQTERIITIVRRGRPW